MLRVTPHQRKHFDTIVRLFRASVEFRDAIRVDGESIMLECVPERTCAIVSEKLDERTDLALCFAILGAPIDVNMTFNKCRAARLTVFLSRHKDRVQVVGRPGHAVSITPLCEVHRPVPRRLTHPPFFIEDN